jgi:hypothetical protein
MVVFLLPVPDATTREGREIFNRRWKNPAAATPRK